MPRLPLSTEKGAWPRLSRSIWLFAFPLEAKGRLSSSPMGPSPSPVGRGTKSSSPISARSGPRRPFNPGQVELWIAYEMTYGGCPRTAKARGSSGPLDIRPQARVLLVNFSAALQVASPAKPCRVPHSLWRDGHQRISFQTFGCFHHHRCARRLLLLGPWLFTKRCS